MIVYTKTLAEFQEDILSNDIGNRIADIIKEIKSQQSVNRREIQAWQNSLQCMHNVLQDADLSVNVNISIEYHIPSTPNKRIDFIISGQNEVYQDVAIIIELKQWSMAEPSQSDGMIQTYFQGGLHETVHPSYQAWSYKSLLENYNEAVEQDAIILLACAYLHNYDRDGLIDNPFYQEYLNEAPIFLKPDAKELRSFITSHIKYGDVNKIMYRIENGRIRPSQQLIEKVSSMLHGNREFIMIDEQKEVFEKAVQLALKAQTGAKQVLIVRGGPGTGKSVVAVNLLVKLIQEKLHTQYVTRNKTPREVYYDKLTSSFKKTYQLFKDKKTYIIERFKGRTTYIKELFKGGGNYYNAEPNQFDALVVDEAHRLTEKSGLWGSKGENQIKEIINASRFSVFFIDEDQRIELRDIGSVDEIQTWANKLEAEVTPLDLSSQFRCSGSGDYISYVDEMLQIRPPQQLSTNFGYDLQVIDSPTELHELIKSKNTSNKARMVAGFCWDWRGKTDPAVEDIVIGDYSARWNLATDSSLWMIRPNSVDEVGCIHTCQGLEVDYIGVIIGDDLIVRNGQVITQPEKRSKHDNSIKGWKKQMKEEPDLTRTRLDDVIKNTYKVLMTRGQKGCYIYCTDLQTQAYFKNLLADQLKSNQTTLSSSSSS